MTGKIAVTAASGGLGVLLVEQLKAAHGADNIVAVVRDPGRFADSEVEVRQGDYADPEQMAAAFDGVDTVILISSPASESDRVQLHRNVIDAGVKAGVRKMIYTSVIGNGDEMNTMYAPMAEVNRQAEEDLAASGMEWIVARNGLYLEFDVAHILNAAAEGVFRNNGGEGYCCYITRTEIAVALAILAGKDDCNGRILNLVGEAYRQDELVDIVNTQAETDVRYEFVDDDTCMAKFVPVRGEVVAAMLTGCYQAIRNGAFDVPSDFEDITGMPCKPMPLMIAEVVAASRAGQSER